VLFNDLYNWMKCRSEDKAEILKRLACLLSIYEDEYDDNKQKISQENIVKLIEASRGILNEDFIDFVLESNKFDIYDDHGAIFCLLESGCIDKELFKSRLETLINKQPDRALAYVYHAIAYGVYKYEELSYIIEQAAKIYPEDASWKNTVEHYMKLLYLKGFASACRNGK